MKIVVEQDRLLQKAGKALNDMVLGGIEKPLLLLLSGGSSLQLLDYVPEESFANNNLTVGMLDDRYSRDPAVNSFAILRSTTFYLNALRRGAVFLDSSVGEFETLEKYAARYETEIKKWIKMNPDGIIRATIGIGPDGHTSGVLPMPEEAKKCDELFDGERLVVGYDVGNKNPHRFRLTSTFTLMRKCNRVLTYMSGENKRQAFISVKAEEGSLSATPGRIIRELKNATVYTDIKI